MRTSVIIKSTILIISLIFISLAATDILYSEMNDKTDRLSQEQSNVFSPGYINAAKQKTETIIGQLDPKKSFMEKVVEYVQNKVSNKVLEDSTDRTQPELKKKTGGEGESHTSTKPDITASLFATAQTSDNLLEEAKQKGTATTTLNNGNTINVWMEGDNAYFNIKDSNGALLFNRQQFNTQEGLDKSYVSDIMDMGQGKFAVIITGYDYKLENDFYKYDSTQSLKVYNSQGVIERQDDYKSYDYQNLRSGERSSDFNIVDKILSGDFNKDGYIGGADVTMILTTWGSKTSDLSDFWKPADINKDGVVDDFEWNFLLERWGSDSVDALKLDISKDSYMPQGNTPLLISQYNSTNLSFEKPMYTTVRDNSSNTYAMLDEPKRTLSAENSKSALNNSYIAKIEASREGVDNYGLFTRIMSNKDALAIPTVFLNEDGKDMSAMAMLASIMKNPTEDQKRILDAVTALLNEVSKQEQESASPELKKATDNLLQAVAAVLIAQAIPDLFKEGDISNIKNIFSELNTQKGRIVLEYQESVKPYYDEILKEMSKNMAILQLKNMLPGKMTKEQLEKLPPNEMDKILEKLRQAKDKSLEEEHILQQEAKYRSLYIEPNKKMLEDNMKHMLEGFTKKLSGVLEEVKK